MTAHTTSRSTNSIIANLRSHIYTTQSPFPGKIKTGETRSLDPSSPPSVLGILNRRWARAGRTPHFGARLIPCILACSQGHTSRPGCLPTQATQCRPLTCQCAMARLLGEAAVTSSSVPSWPLLVAILELLEVSPLPLGAASREKGKVGRSFPDISPGQTDNNNCKRTSPSRVAMWLPAVVMWGSARPEETIVSPFQALVTTIHAPRLPLLLPSMALPFPCFSTRRSQSP